VATAQFVCKGEELMDISAQAPIFQAMEGRAAGELCSFNGRELLIELVM
jgi:hypothetical protein